VILVLIYAPVSLAFHQGGVASCGGCHIMHASENGLPVTPGYTDLLIAETASDVCLTCHADENGAVFGGHPLSPPPQKGAGNFIFLLEDNLNDGPNGASNPIGGHAAGHSVVAPSMGVGPDPEWMSSPGGSFPSNLLACTSCHDPHGNQNFRMLRGLGDQLPNGHIFVYPAPDALGIDLDPFSAETTNLHTAYLSGMSAWCANCHEDYLLDDHAEHGASSFEHDTDRPMSDEAHHYNAYNGSADPNGGSQATAYLPEVPFESAGSTTISTEGPHPSNRMHCLTCHRAHASSGPRSGRWDFNVATLGEDGQVSGSFALPNPYGDPTQKPLCEKCHEIDEGLRDAAQWEFHR
jgi:predicted CXXCH cytochrome family protein